MCVCVCILSAARISRRRTDRLACGRPGESPFGGLKLRKVGAREMFAFFPTRRESTPMKLDTLSVRQRSPLKVRLVGEIFAFFLLSFQPLGIHRWNRICCHLSLSGSQPLPTNVQQAISSHTIVFFNKPVYTTKSPLAVEARPARKISLEREDEAASRRERDQQIQTQT